MKTILALCVAGALLLTGCVASSLDRVVQKADTAHKHIHAHVSTPWGYGDYESWPVYENTNGSVITITQPALQIRQSQ